VCEILAAGEAPTATPAAVAKAAEESVAPLAKEAPVAFASAAMHAAQAPASSPQAAPVQAETSSAAASDASTAGNGARHSPAVRRLARMHHIDLSGVPGSGRGGRLTARDVIAHVESGAAKTAASVAPAAAAKPQPTPQPPAQSQPPAPTPSPVTAATKMVAPPPVAPQPATASQAPAAPAATPAAAGTLIKVPAASVQPLPIAPPGPDDVVIRLSQMRKTIADRMVLSKTTIPHAWSMVEADVTNLVKWRTKEKDAFKVREGVSLTYLPIVIQAVCAAIREYPMVNATWAGDSIIQRRHINVGVAVDIEDGLIVPVVKDADRYSLAGLATTINELVSRARSRKLTMDDLSDGTITVDNTGSLGSIASVPIINPPQAAIITTEAIVRRPWVVEDAIAIRHIMNLCLCLDHRVLDGAVASHFLQAVKKRLETFSG
jgi:2-oxoisovalerate dehydrogenase E2 component (dihydrolipoyl transacylase)